MLQRTQLFAALTAVVLMTVACNSNSQIASSQTQSTPTEKGEKSGTERPFTAEPVSKFDSPWAMAALDDGRLLITEKKGVIKIFDPQTGLYGNVSGVPQVVDKGQGGLGDIALHPEFFTNRYVYISYAEPGENGTQGAAVARAELSFDSQGAGKLSDLKVIWRQVPKVTGDGHYGHRLVFGPDKKLWISSSERQKFDPAQDMASNLGKIIRLNDDGSVPSDNPFANQGGVTAQIWSLGHRNILGMAFDDKGTLWENEMGPKGGDEFNLIEKGKNYGYPIVSNGDHYDGRDIPDHDTRPEFVKPKITWTPVISPSSMIIYSGDLFPQWKGNALIGGLSSQSLVRVEMNGTDAKEVERFNMGKRIRSVMQGKNGEIWLLEDGKDGRLLRLEPRQ